MRDYTEELTQKQQDDLEAMIDRIINRETWNEITGEYIELSEMGRQKLAREILWQVFNYYKPEILTNPVFF